MEMVDPRVDPKKAIELPPSLVPFDVILRKVECSEWFLEASGGAYVGNKLTNKMRNPSNGPELKKWSKCIKLTHSFPYIPDGTTCWWAGFRFELSTVNNIKLSSSFSCSMASNWELFKRYLSDFSREEKKTNLAPIDLLASPQVKIVAILWQEKKIYSSLCNYLEIVTLKFFRSQKYSRSTRQPVSGISESCSPLVQWIQACTKLDFSCEKGSRWNVTTLLAHTLVV